MIAFKQRLIDYLQRFVSDLVGRSGAIASRLNELEDRIEPLLLLAAQRERRDAAPGDAPEQATALAERVATWRGLSRWFISDGHIQAQSELLRAKVRSAIPQLLAAMASLNDRSADFRILARWFADTGNDAEAHRLWRAGFAFNPARHFSLQADTATTDPVPAGTAWPAGAASCRSIPGWPRWRRSRPRWPPHWPR